MIATAKQIEAVEPLTCYSADYEQGYMEGYAQGWVDASGITDGDAFFEIGLAVLCLAIGGLVGWAVALL
jgi:hypothetical protein